MKRKLEASELIFKIIYHILYLFQRFIDITKQTTHLTIVGCEQFSDCITLYFYSFLIKSGPFTFAGKIIIVNRSNYSVIKISSISFQRIPISVWC